MIYKGGNQNEKIKSNVSSSRHGEFIGLYRLCR